MADFSATLEAIESKLKKLIKKKVELESNLKDANIRLGELEKKLDSQAKEIEELNEKNKILRIASNSGEKDNREIKLKINEIVREVDKCIAQLNQ